MNSGERDLADHHRLRCTPHGQLVSAEPTAWMSSSMVTTPLPLTSIAAQASRPVGSSAMSTATMSSSMLTTPLPSQSPTQGSGRSVTLGRGDWVRVRVGVRLGDGAVGVGVGVILPDAVTVGVPDSVGITVRPGRVEVGKGVNVFTGVNVLIGVKLWMGVKVSAGVKVSRRVKVGTCAAAANGDASRAAASRARRRRITCEIMRCK